MTKATPGIAFGPPALARNLHTSVTLAQLTLTGCLLGLAGGQLIAGSLSDRFGRRVPLVIGVAGFAVSSLLCALTSNIWLLVVLRLVQGACGGAGIVIARAVARDLYSGDDAARFFALLMLVMGVTPILAPVLGGQVLNYTSWRGIFLVLGGLGALLLLLAVLALPETLPVRQRRDGGVRSSLTAYHAVLADRFFLGCALTGGFTAGGMFAYISGSPFVLQTMFGVSPQHYALIFGGNALGLTLASQLSGALVGRINLITLVWVGIAMSATGAALLVAAAVAGAGLAVVLPALFLLVFAQGFVGPNATAMALDRYGRSAGSAAAVLGVTLFAVGAVVAPLVGLAGSATLWPLAVVTVGTSSSAFLALVFGVLRAPRSALDILAA